MVRLTIDGCEIQRVRKVMSPCSGKTDWQITLDIAHAMGCRMDYGHPSGIMDEIARVIPSFAGISYARLD